MKEKIDAYESFFKSFGKGSKEKFLQFGMDNIIFIPTKDVKRKWTDLVNRISTSKKNIYIRNAGRNGNRSVLFEKMYKDIFNIEVKFDGSNNTQPTRMLQDCTGYKKNENIFNFQVAHVFGRTKNIFCFTAPWNIVFIPKIIDPFTGHEAKGDYKEEFQKKFQKKVFQKFEEQIKEYNQLMKKWRPEIEKWLDVNKIGKKECGIILKEFEEISLNVEGYMP